MPGQLYKFNLKEKEKIEPSFCFVVDGKINNKAPWHERHQGIRNKNSLVMHVKDFDLTKKTAMASVMATAMATAMVTAMGAATAMSGVSSKDFDKAWKEWIKTGKIQGGIFLTVNDSKYIWISHYDLEYFKKVES